MRTHIQSGNVLFEGPERDAAALGRRIEARLAGLLGGKATVVFRKVHALQDAVKAAPFDSARPGPDLKLYVAFLQREPARRPPLPLVSPKEGLEKEFAVPATTRNRTTVGKIAELSQQEAGRG